MCSFDGFFININEDVLNQSTNQEETPKAALIIAEGEGRKSPQRSINRKKENNTVRKNCTRSSAAEVGPSEVV